MMIKAKDAECKEGMVATELAFIASCKQRGQLKQPVYMGHQTPSPRAVSANANLFASRLQGAQAQVAVR